MGNERFIIQGFGLQNLRTQVYKPGIDAADARADVVPPKTQFKLTNDTGFVRDPPIRFSALGTPVYSDLQFGRVSVDGVQLPEFFPIDTVLYTVSQTKNIVTTNIQGRNGSVKEYISDGDAQINIKGVLCGRNGEYPVDAMNALMEYLNAPVSIPIYSQYLVRLGIYEVVVTGYSFPQTMGGYSTQLFEISCISDTPVILKAQ